jgi:hypothetical protein
MKKIFLIFNVVLILNSCFLFKENGIDVLINNNSEKSISNVIVTTSENLNSVDIIHIGPGENAKDFLSMKNNQSDGSYILEFTRQNGKKETIGAGYYTNGGSLNSLITFEIDKDTVFAVISKN